MAASVAFREGGNLERASFSEASASSAASHAAASGGIPQRAATVARAGCGTWGNASVASSHRLRVR